MHFSNQPYRKDPHKYCTHTVEYIHVDNRIAKVTRIFRGVKSEITAIVRV